MQTGCGGSPLRFYGPTRLMQRPKLVKMRRSAMVAAAELERQGSSKRRKMTGRRKWEDQGRAYLEEKDN